MIRTNLHDLLPKAFLALLVIFAQSCFKDDPGDNDRDGSTSELPLEITAKAPSRPAETSCSSVAVKTMTPDGAKVYWEPGDQVAVYPGASVEAERYRSIVYTTDIDEPQAAATFTREPGLWNYEEGDFYYAAYPYSSVDRWGSTGNRTCYLHAPVFQTARTGGWDPNAGCLVAMSRTSEFFFEHVYAYVKFTVDGSTSPCVALQVAVPGVASTVVGDYDRATDFITQVQDEAKVTYDEDAITTQPHYASQTVLDNDYAPSQYPSTKVVLNSPDGQQFKAGSYYLAILPHTYPNGLSFVFWSADGQVAVKKLAGPLAVDRGDVVNVGMIGELNFHPAIENHTIWSDNQGVVFWVDESDPTKGKIVSICNHQETKWSTSLAYYGGNTDNPVDNYEAAVAGRTNEFIEENLPAIDYCKKLRKSNGGNWHLPSVEELRVLYNSYYGRNYISPIIAGSTNNTKGYDFRYKNGNQSVAGYQAVLTSKKHFDELLAQAGEPSTASSPASLDGVNVTGNVGKYLIDSQTETDDYGNEHGVNYWTGKETRPSGDTNGQSAFYVRIGRFIHYHTYKDGTSSNANIKDNKYYVRCIKDVSLN